MLRFLRLFTTTLLLKMALGCAPSRPPVPPGVIPELRKVSVSDEEYGHEVFSALVEQYPLDQDDQNVARARGIVERLAQSAKASNDPWHVYVLKDDDVVNAAATRGNHVFVWTGLMNMAKTDDELATVLAHEIGHLLAGHTDPDPNEQIQEILASIAGEAVRIVVAQQGAAPYGADIAGSLTNQVVKASVMNPGSQRKEIEADTIGLFLMSDAGYDPNQALSFWERIQEMPGMSLGALQFLSTHPAPEGRLENIRRHLPEAARRSQNQDVVEPAATTTISNENRYWIAQETAMVFDAPSEDGARIGTLHRGDTVHVIARLRRWLRINHPIEGFVKSSSFSPHSIEN